MKTLTMIALQVCLAAATFAAQLPNKITVTLPSAVKVGDVTIPAGGLTLEGNSLTDDYPVITLRSENGMAVQALVLRLSTPHGQTAGQTKVALRRVDDTFYLDKIWVAGQDVGFQVLAGAPRQ
jgi:hypothetical protein